MQGRWFLSLASYFFSLTVDGPEMTVRVESRNSGDFGTFSSNSSKNYDVIADKSALNDDHGSDNDTVHNIQLISSDASDVFTCSSSTSGSYLASHITFDVNNSDKLNLDQDLNDLDSESDILSDTNSFHSYSRQWSLSTSRLPQAPIPIGQLLNSNRSQTSKEKIQKFFGDSSLPIVSGSGSVSKLTNYYGVSPALAEKRADISSDPLAPTLLRNMRTVKPDSLSQSVKPKYSSIETLYHAPVPSIKTKLDDKEKEQISSSLKESEVPYSFSPSQSPLPNSPVNDAANGMPLTIKSKDKLIRFFGDSSIPLAFGAGSISKITSHYGEAPASFISTPSTSAIADSKNELNKSSEGSFVTLHDNQDDNSDSTLDSEYIDKNNQRHSSTSSIMTTSSSSSSISSLSHLECIPENADNASNTKIDAYSEIDEYSILDSYGNNPNSTNNSNPYLPALSPHYSVRKIVSILGSEVESVVDIPIKDIHPSASSLSEGFKSLWVSRLAMGYFALHLLKEFKSEMLVCRCKTMVKLDLIIYIISFLCWMYKHLNKHCLHQSLSNLSQRNIFSTLI